MLQWILENRMSEVVYLSKTSVMIAKFMTTTRMDIFEKIKFINFS